ncbi:hypothetical protein FKP32DRAFT_837019 [Trametes sanguinea]|nr:hypothetical protein FKP32DRAFT_837019 [Trametes sanguinea]
MDTDARSKGQRHLPKPKPVIHRALEGWKTSASLPNFCPPSRTGRSSSNGVHNVRSTSRERWSADGPLPAISTRQNHHLCGRCGSIVIPFGHTAVHPAFDRSYRHHAAGIAVTAGACSVDSSTVQGLQASWQTILSYLTAFLQRPRQFYDKASNTPRGETKCQRRRTRSALSPQSTSTPGSKRMYYSATSTCNFADACSLAVCGPLRVTCGAYAFVPAASAPTTSP